VNDIPWTKLGNTYATAPIIISEVHRADTASHSASISVAFIVLVDFNVASTIHGSLLLHGLSTIDAWQTHDPLILYLGRCLDCTRTHSNKRGPERRDWGTHVGGSHRFQGK